MARLQQSDHVAGPDDGARLHGGLHRLVRRAQAVVVVHRHHATAAHRSGEHHGAGARGENGLTGGAHEVDAPMAAPVRVRRGFEPRRDGGRRQERPRVPGPGCGDPRTARR
jgi:hypothetical protein